MAFSVVMPALEMAQETGKIISWMKREGDAITKGEPLLEIETDKIVVELEAPADGLLAGVRAQAGAEVPVGQTIAWIVAPGEEPPAEDSGPALQARAVTEQARPSPSSAASASSASAAPAAAAAPQRSAGGPRVSPKAKRIAQEKGVDLNKVIGTGPDGQITGEDVLKAAEAATAPAPAPAPAAAPAASSSAVSSVARLMAERTTQSWQQVPHFFLVREVDASGLNEARSKSSVKISHTDLLISLTARALAKHPKMNASWVDGALRMNPGINITMAIAVKDGVMGAVIPEADKATLAQIAEQRQDLAERARSGKLRPQDIHGGTFTISNLGMFGVDAFSAIITQPQAAVLAVGRISDRVVAVDGKPAVRPMLSMTLSSDHRVVDGAQAAAFLSDLAEALRNPQSWLG